VTTVLGRGVQLETGEAGVPAQRVAPAGATGRVPGGGGVVLVDDVTAASPQADIVDQWGVQSFPASDPPANW
jgi:hypothetical protein